MTSSFGSAPSYNFTHMFDFTDPRGPLPKNKPCPGTLLDIIQKNPDFSKFSYMVKLADLDQFFNSSQADYTVFVPSDSALKERGISDSIFINMDILTAREIVRTSTVFSRLSFQVLQDSPASYLYPANKNNRLFITNIGGETFIGDSMKVIHPDVLATNGIIHVINNLMVPIII